ncbi:hypothetical protein [Neisseria subflava]|uniref:hypothetical protein n=1 Tax=Neisseria subflava TaxID=28449 RepID=UPI0019022AFD|nr:hypothetical protein [Neisseria subflava]
MWIEDKGRLKRKLKIIKGKADKQAIGFMQATACCCGGIKVFLVIYRFWYFCPTGLKIQLLLLLHDIGKI